MAGRLGDRITIQTKGTPSRGSQGEEQITWSTYLTVYAEAQPIRGQEFVALRAAQSIISIRFKIRYRSGINTSMRVLWRGDPYEIIEIIDVDAKKKELHLMCSGDSEDA